LIWRFEHGTGGRKLSKADIACDVSLFVKKEFEGQMKKTPNCVLATGWKWVMQLRATDGKWVDWIVIQKSNRPGATSGVWSLQRVVIGIIPTCVHLRSAMANHSLAALQRMLHQFHNKALTCSSDEEYCMMNYFIWSRI
jgi:hypothetical protein